MQGEYEGPPHTYDLVSIANHFNAIKLKHWSDSIYHLQTGLEYQEVNKALRVVL
jgi:hypothetical protein